MATDSSLSQEDRLLVFVRLKPMKNNDKASKIFRVMSNKVTLSREKKVMIFDEFRIFR